MLSFAHYDAHHEKFAQFFRILQFMRLVRGLTTLGVGVLKKIDLRDRKLDVSCVRQVDRTSLFFGGEYEAMLIH